MQTLRPYQNEALEAVRDAYRQGYKAPCLVAPCGAGKSVIMAEMARLARKGFNNFKGREYSEEQWAEKERRELEYQQKLLNKGGD
ncbi:hypothetical protein FACS189490_13890 [Clostridia bacterium]|nr:hypothetical protein FACS189490_13890 [Clostridia bacterium]